MCRRVLVIDDEESIGRVLARLLRPARVDRVTSAEEARKLLDLGGDEFDVLICDLMMRPESGKDFVGGWRRTIRSSSDASCSARAAP
ncbi:MAG: response regulator transcription factor [Myxococcales bacterium]|nr:response regulator transcription factor [Myxococcales bacterium]